MVADNAGQPMLTQRALDRIQRDASRWRRLARAAPVVVDERAAVGTGVGEAVHVRSPSQSCDNHAHAVEPAPLHFLDTRHFISPPIGVAEQSPRLSTRRYNHVKLNPA